MTKEQIKLLTKILDNLEDDRLKHKIVQLIAQGIHNMELTSTESEPLSFNGNQIIANVGVSMDGKFECSALLHPAFNYKLVEDMKGVLVMIITPKNQEELVESMAKVKGTKEVDVEDLTKITDEIDRLGEDQKARLVNEDDSINCAECGVRMNRSAEIGDICMGCKNVKKG